MNASQSMATLGLASILLAWWANAQDQDVVIDKPETPLTTRSAFLVENINTDITRITLPEGFNLPPLERPLRIFPSLSSPPTLDQQYRVSMDNSKQAILGILSLNGFFIYQRTEGQISRSDSIGIRIPDILGWVPNHFSFTSWRTTGNPVIRGYTVNHFTFTFSIPLKY